MPASPPPSVLPNRPSPSRPADASSKFVVSEAATTEVEGAEPIGPAVGSGSAVGESIESGDASGPPEEHAIDTPSEEKDGDDEVSLPSAGGTEVLPESDPDSLAGAPLLPTTVHSVSNPLPELELVSQNAGQQRSVATLSKGKVAPVLNAPVTLVHSAVPRQTEFASNLVQPGSAVGSSAELLLDQASITPSELGSKTASPSEASRVHEPEVGPRAQDVNNGGRSPERSGGDTKQVSNRLAGNQTKVLAEGAPFVDHGVGQVVSDATRPTPRERLEVSGAQKPVFVEESFQRGEAFKSTTRPEGRAVPSSSVEASVPAQEVAGDSARTAPQGNAPQPTKVNALSQGMNFNGGLAEGVDGGPAEEVPASVNLTRRALRSLGRGHGGATVVQLRPAQFGKVTVRVQMEEGRVQADLVARTPEAARVLGEHLRLLRDSLEHKGLVVDRLEVREESKVESSRLDQHNEKDTDEDRSGGERDRQDGNASSKRSSPRMAGGLDDRADEFGQVLMAAEEQA